MGFFVSCIIDPLLFVYHLHLLTSIENGYLVIPTLYKWKARLREVEELAQRHTAYRNFNQELYLVLSGSKATLKLYYKVIIRINSTMVKHPASEIQLSFNFCYAIYWLHNCICLPGQLKQSTKIRLIKQKLGFPGGTTCQCRRYKRCELNLWVGKIPWNRKWQPTPGFLPGKFHGQRSQVGYSPCGHKEWAQLSDWEIIISQFYQHVTDKLVPSRGCSREICSTCSSVSSDILAISGILCPIETSPWSQPSSLYRDLPACISRSKSLPFIRIPVILN